MIIRELTEYDYDNFFHLINDFRPTTFTLQEYKEYLKLINLSSKVYVIEENSKLVATCTLHIEHKFIFNLCKLAHIEDVCVKKEHRKQGLGKIIIEYCIKEAINQNAYKITLNCADNNIGFYTKCGFERRGNQMTILLKEPI
jgi:N-acetylglutamate synthase-like GNAT family acetyltransferase